MLKPMLVRFVVLSIIATPVAAQIGPSPFAERKTDPAQFAALMANSQRTMKPASFVLDHKTELGLTPEQVKQLDVLVRDETDSAVVRQIRLTAAVYRDAKSLGESNAAPQTGWVGVVDEKKLRDDACRQAGMGVEVMLNLMRDRQVVGRLLTAGQIERIQELEMNDMVRVMTPKQP